MDVVKNPVLEIVAPCRNATVVATLESVLPETTSESGTTYKKLLFRDKAVNNYLTRGTEIPGTLFGDDIELFSDVFCIGRDYEITNAVINSIPEHVRRGSQTLQMIIRSTTKVTEVVADCVARRSYIVPLDSANEYLDHQGRLDIVGIAVHVASPRKVHPRYRNTEFDARDVILVDRSMKPTKLTVWQAFVFAEAQMIADMLVEHPVVLATHVSASKFNRGSWSSTFFSTIRSAYDGPEAVDLKQWEKDNDIEIAKIVAAALTDAGDSSRAILPIAALNFQKDGSTVWIKGQVTDVINPDNCVYSSCSECKSGTDTPLGEKFPCSQTKTPHIGTSMFRYKLHVRFEDETSAIKLTLFHELAEKVLGRTAADISLLSCEERLSVISDFVDSLRERQFTIKLLSKKFGASKKQLRFSALEVEEISE